MASIGNVVLRHGIFRFRRAVSTDLRIRIGRCELVRTLGAGDPRDAKMYASQRSQGAQLGSQPQEPRYRAFFVYQHSQPHVTFTAPPSLSNNTRLESPLDRLKQALELEFLEGALKSASRPKSASTSVIIGPPLSLPSKDVD